MHFSATTTVAMPNGCWRLVKNQRKGSDDLLVQPNTDGGYVARSRKGRNSDRSHRLLYEQWIGPIDKGMTIDHLCKNPACCNPGHMEVVSRGENARRGRSANAAKTHCSNGHEFSEANTWRGIQSNGAASRKCRTCARERMAKRKLLYASPGGQARPRGVN